MQRLAAARRVLSQPSRCNAKADGDCQQASAWLWTRGAHPAAQPPQVWVPVDEAGRRHPLPLLQQLLLQLQLLQLLQLLPVLLPLLLLLLRRLLLHRCSDLLREEGVQRQHQLPLHPTPLPLQAAPKPPTSLASSAAAVAPRRLQLPVRLLSLQIAPPRAHW